MLTIRIIDNPIRTYVFVHSIRLRFRCTGCMDLDSFATLTTGTPARIRNPTPVPARKPLAYQQVVRLCSGTVQF